MRALPRVVLLAAVVETLLAAAGVLITPAALRGGGALALVGVALVQLLCVVLARYGALSTTRAAPVAIRIGVCFGLVAGGLYGAEVFAEYVSPAVTEASAIVGWIIVIGLVTCAVVAAAIVSWREQSVRAGGTVAVYAMMIEYLTWYPVLLLSYYAFHSSAATERVWRSEGTYDDFARSGMTDIHAFVLQDFWGAGVFHLLAGMLIAIVFGTTAAAISARRGRTKTYAPQ